jgi:hypothetical protein
MFRSKLNPGDKKKKGPKKTKKMARAAEKKKHKTYKKVEIPANGAAAARIEFVTDSEGGSESEDSVKDWE